MRQQRVTRSLVAVLASPQACRAANVNRTHIDVLARSVNAVPRAPGWCWRKKIKKMCVAMGATSLLFAQSAFANFSCSGTVQYLAVNSGSSLYVVIGTFGVWAICGLNGSTSNGGTTVNVDACKAWYSALLANQKTGSVITFYFASASNGANGPECTALGTWVLPNPVPYHMEIGS